MPQADVVHATAKDDARDGRRGDRADIAEGPQQPGRGAGLSGRSLPLQGLGLHRLRLEGELHGRSLLPIALARST